MLIDDVQSDIMHELARIHKRKMAPLKKALESAPSTIRSQIAASTFWP